jgi:transposase
LSSLKAPGPATKKKSRAASEQDRPDVQKARQDFTQQITTVPASRQFYIDEAGASTDMTRLYGRAPKGQRVTEKVPGGHWSVTTMISAIGLSGPVAGLIFEGATDAAAFTTFVEQILVPQLRRGDVVILDNLSSHKVKAVREAIEGAGAQLWYLPPYSPDLNPIEKMWSKVKQWLRSVKARTKEALWEAICEALNQVTATDCCGFFAACGISL